MNFSSKCKYSLFTKLYQIFNINLTAIVLCLVFITGICDAQVRLETPGEKETTLMDRLWFGGNVNLGFQGSNNYNVFFFGLSPMAGYKITEDFSVGPRIEVFYTYYRAYVFNEGRNYSAHPISLTGGVFARHKFLRQFFGHVEFNVERATFPLRDFSGNFFSEDGKLATGTRTFENFYLGLGYFSGGKVGSEISILYNVLEAQETLNIPISIRIGMNYNF